jgi:3-deoxy-manno-octulosonate cytidylyltransferase (CMP-KDO synthetase)
MIITIIPARYNSSRLPGKMLLKINNKSIIQRTYEQSKKSKLVNRVIIATDDQKIVEESSKINAECILISDNCLNGTERIAKAYKKINQKYKYILNIQGDEPFIKPDHIDYLIKNHKEGSVCSTLHYKIKNKNDLHNKGIVKIITNKNNQVIYGSRAMIPSSKNGESINSINYYAHIGIFLFDSEFIFKFLEHENTPAQLSEDLEWLKIIEMGYKLYSYEVDEPEIGINTQEEFNYLSKKYSK